MKWKSTAGYTLVEVMVAIVILGLVTVPMTSGMVAAMKMNNKAEEMMKAQLAVSSAVETLMATGISSTADPDLPGVDITITPVAIDVDAGEYEPYYQVVVVSEANQTVTVSTCVRKAGGAP